LKALFSTLKDKIRVVVLNACYSKEQAEAITQVIDCAVGMSDSIGDRAAITFAASFYRAIAFGRSVKEAFDQGIASLLLEGIPEEDTPKLITKDGVSPSDIYLLDRNILRADSAQDKRALRNAMLGSFSREDITLLCNDIEEELKKDGKDIGVSLDRVTGNTRLDIQILDLIEYLENRGHLDYLVKEVQRNRPGLKW